MRTCWGAAPTSPFPPISRRPRRVSVPGVVPFVLLSGAFFFSGCARHPGGNGQTDAPDLGGPGSGISPTGAPIECPLSANFTTVGDVAPVDGQGPQFEAVATVPAQSGNSSAPGTVWVLGTGQNSAPPAYWLARQSCDGGSTWSQVNTFQYQGSQVSGSARLYADANQRLSVSGWVQDQNAVEHWVVQQSDMKGLSWTVAENYAYAAGKSAVPWAIRGDSLGTIYTMGFGTDANDARHWVLRASKDSGQTFSTIDDYIYFGGARAEANDMASDSAGGIYVIGFGNDGTTNTSHHWIVRRSLDFGVTFSTMDDYQLSTGQQSIPYGIFVDTADNLNVIGLAEDAGQADHWIMRRSTDRGQTFTTVDDFQLGQGQDSYGLAVTSGDGGAMFAAGEGKDAAGLSHFLVRRSDDGGTTWAAVDDYTGPGGYGAGGRGLSRGPLGDLYTAGYYNDSQQAQHGLVRKLACR